MPWILNTLMKITEENGLNAAGDLKSYLMLNGIHVETTLDTHKVDRKGLSHNTSALPSNILSECHTTDELISILIKMVQENENITVIHKDTITSTFIETVIKHESLLNKIYFKKKI